MQEYIPPSETEIKFITKEKPDEFEQVRNVGTIQEYKDIRDKTFWERIGVGGSITAGPIVYNDTIYIGACDKNFYALDLDGKEKWKFATGGPIQAYAAAKDGIIYFGSGDKNLYALNSKTGQLIWKFMSYGHIGGSPVWYDGRIYFGSSDGSLYALNASDGKKIWVFKTPYPLITPLIKDDKIYVGYNGSSLYCLNFNGELLWKFNANAYIAAWPAVAEGDTIYFGSGDKNLYAIKSNGQLKWKYSTKGRADCPAVKDGKICFGGGDNKLYCLDSNGNKLWDFKTNDIVSQVTIFGNIVYFGSFDNNLYAVNKDSGELIWKFRTNGFITSDPKEYKDFVIIGSWDCNLYCLNKEGKLLWRFQTSMSSPSKIEPPEQTEIKKIELTITTDIEKGEEKKYKADNVMGEYEANVTEYASGIKKTYLSSKRSYIN